MRLQRVQCNDLLNTSLAITQRAKGQIMVIAFVPSLMEHLQQALHTP